jgi:AcrR family transcriptional regulator
VEPEAAAGKAGGAVPGARRRVGAGPRRLDPSRDAAILRAAFEGVAEHGYDRLTMDDIAARAGVGKAAIYRRWPSKAAVVVSAIGWRREQMGAAPVPDTGSLRGDVDAVVAMVPEFTEHDQSAIGVILGVATAATRDPALAAALHEHLLEHARRQLREILGQAVDRGEIPRGRDLTLVPDVLFGLNAMRLVTGQPIDRAWIRQVFEQVILPLVTAPLPAPASRPRQAPGT